MKTLIMLVLVSAALAAAPSAGYADETPVESVVVDNVDNVAEVLDVDPEADHVVGPILAAANMIQIQIEAVDAVQEVPPAPVPAPDDVVNAVVETTPIPIDDFAGAIQTLGGLVAVMGAITPLVVECIKAAWPAATPWVLRAIAILIGALGGLFVGLGWFGAVSYSIGAAILAGAAGGAGFAIIKAGSQWARSSSKSGRGFGNITTLIVVAGAGLILIFMVGCGTVFTVKAGDAVRWDVKPTTPAHAVVLVEDAEVCRVNVPDGTIAISNTCPTGQVSTMDTTGQVPTCVSNPCPPGTSFTFLSTGLAACQ